MAEAMTMQEQQLPSERNSANKIIEAMGLDTAEGSSTGRKLIYLMSAQIDESDGTHFVQLATQDPLRIWRLSPQEASTLSQELAEVTAVLKRINQEQCATPNLSTYQTIIGNETVLAMRKATK